MTRDDVNFLSAAGTAADRLCTRSARAFAASEATVTLSYDEHKELAIALDRVVQIATAAHLEQARGQR